MGAVWRAGGRSGTHGGGGHPQYERLYTQNALNGYILHVDFFPSGYWCLSKRRCANNLNQVATHANSYGAYQEEIKPLQKDYADLWGPLSNLLQKLFKMVRPWQKGVAPCRSSFANPISLILGAIL